VFFKKNIDIIFEKIQKKFRKILILFLKKNKFFFRKIVILFLKKPIFFLEKLLLNFWKNPSFFLEKLLLNFWKNTSFFLEKLLYYFWKNPSFFLEQLLYYFWKNPSFFYKNYYIILGAFQKKVVFVHFCIKSDVPRQRLILRPRFLHFLQVSRYTEVPRHEPSSTLSLRTPRRRTSEKLARFFVRLKRVWQKIRTRRNRNNGHGGGLLRKILKDNSKSWPQNY